MTIRAVFFDVGETLVNETRQWAAWADFLGISQLSFFAALGAIIERGQHHSRVFELLRPGFDLAQAQRERQKAELPDELKLEDFYPDALPCLRALRQRGWLIGLAGNQPARAEDLLREFALPVDWVASSARWGVEKPDRRFFERILELTQLPADQIAYVGDRVDNDVIPAAELGLCSVFIRRGPWGYIQAAQPEAALARLRLESLDELPLALERC